MVNSVIVSSDFTRFYFPLPLALHRTEKVMIKERLAIISESMGVILQLSSTSINSV